jgi:hypothetical protein
MPQTTVGEPAGQKRTLLIGGIAAMQATVVFDDSQTTVAALTRATTDAGYPSTPVKGAGK